MTIPESLAREAELIERDAWLDLFAAAPAEVSDALGLASASVAGMGLLGCRALPITELNRAMAVGIEREPSRGDLDDAVAWLDARATGWALQIAPVARGDGALAYAASAGLAPAGMGWAKFVRTGDAPPPAPAPGVAVERAGAATAEAFGAAVAGGFGLPPACAAWFAALATRPAWRCFLATVDGEPAGGGTLFVADGGAWLGIAGTLPAHRGRGVQRAVVAARLAAASGTRFQTSETGQPAEGDTVAFPSYRNQARAGYERAYVRPNYTRAD